MDGNGRWAQRRGYPRVFGHIRGSSRVRPIVKAASELGVQALTLYAFSTENWSRPESERQVLWRLLKKYLKKEAEELHNQNVRLRVIGEIERLESDVRDVVDSTINKLKGNTGLQLTFAVSYGGRREIIRAAQEFARECAEGFKVPQELSEGLFEKYLWTADLGALSDVDLLIRTSGERRISNFLIWQAAYAECFFMDTCWPDFSPHDLQRAVDDYAQRERRFGGISGVGSEFTSSHGNAMLSK